MEYCENELIRICTEVPAPDALAMDKARERQAQLAKPPGSLGLLEELSVRLAAMSGKVHNHIEKKHILVFAADNGVVQEGVSSAPASVTLMQTINLTRGKTGAATLARHFDCELTVCDVGVDADIACDEVINRKIAYGTANIANGPAMKRCDAVRAILYGFELAQKTSENGADVIGIGEMGIGNTTTSSAILSALTGLTPETVTGRGGGITDESYAQKLAVIKRALEINSPNRDDVVDVIAKVGGFDIAAMTGAFIGTAYSRKPAVIDGFISIVAALCASRLCPNALNYLVASHESYEIGYRIAVKELGLKPMFTLGMRLGEGSGCPLAFEVLGAACAIINEMATFDESGIDDSYLNCIRSGDNFTVDQRNRSDK